MYSLISISAAVILAMESECYMTAGGFFALRLMIRAAKRLEEKQRQRKRIEDQVRWDIKKEED